MTAADFRGAVLKDCEFRRSTLRDLLGVECLAGSAMRWPDIVELAGTFAHALGIAVLQDG